MGCWDIFCILCGNPCHSAVDDIKARFLESIEYYESNKPKRKLFKISFKPIYEKYNQNPNLFLGELNNLKNNTKWLNKCTFLTANNNIVHNCKEVSCNINFQDKNNNLYEHGNTYQGDDQMYGIFVHTDCWKFVKKEYNIKLSYGHLPILKTNKTSYKIFNFIDYGIIEKYWEQNFNFINLIVDSNNFLCDSPLKSNLVSKNIKKIISQLKIRLDPKRKGPSVSATFYENNLYKVGLNGNIWFTKSNKWIEIKETIKYKIIINNKYSIIKNFVYISDINTIPFFILKEKFNKKIIEYEFLTTNKYLEQYIKKYI